MRELNTKYRISDTQKDRLINQIIEEEWHMFGEVKNEGGRAACQDDADTFYAMRYSMFSIMSEETLKACLNFIGRAAGQGRNLLEEKYGYIMEYTDKEYFDRELRDRLPKVSHENEKIISGIRRLLETCQGEFEKLYPKLSARSRPSKAAVRETVTINKYMTGELKTWSNEALQLYLRDIMRMCADKVNPVSKIQERTVQFYGYEGLDAAEQDM